MSEMRGVVSPQRLLTDKKGGGGSRLPATPFDAYRLPSWEIADSPKEVGGRRWKSGLVEETTAICQREHLLFTIFTHHVIDPEGLKWHVPAL